MKPDRQNVILQIISECEIETQAQLLEELEKRGIYSTQATLSRDIKDLQLIKQPVTSGRYCYVFSSHSKSQSPHDKLKKIFKESVISVDIAQNIIVIKTLPGLASAACSALDGMNIDNLVGTIAGDDTAFLAMKDFNSASLLLHEVEDLF